MNKLLILIFTILVIGIILAFSINSQPEINENYPVNTNETCKINIEEKTPIPNRYITIESFNITTKNGYFELNTTKKEIFYSVQTKGTSMHPMIQNGTILIYTRPDKPKIGDIIIFKRQTDNKSIAHRIIEINNSKYITKGDNNKIIDKYNVDFNDINGVVIGIIW